MGQPRWFAPNDPALLEAWRALDDLAGFRKVLVHGYYRLDLERVITLLKDDSQALEEFAALVAGLLD